MTSPTWNCFSRWIPRVPEWRPTVKMHLKSLQCGNVSSNIFIKIIKFIGVLWWCHVSMLCKRREHRSALAFSFNAAPMLIPSELDGIKPKFGIIIQVLVLPSLSRIEAHFAETGHTKFHSEDKPCVHGQGEWLGLLLLYDMGGKLISKLWKSSWN